MIIFQTFLVKLYKMFYKILWKFVEEDKILQNYEIPRI